MGFTHVMVISHILFLEYPSVKAIKINDYIYIYQNWYLMVPRNRVNEPQIIENDKFGNW